MEKFLQLLSLQGLQVSQVASELLGVEDIRHSCLKTWKLSGELQALVSYLREVHDLLAEKIIQRGLDTELLIDRARRTTLLYPDLVKLRARHHVTLVH